MNKPDRRQILQTLALGGAGLMIPSTANAQGKPFKPIEVAELSKLKHEWDSVQFLIGSNEALLVRVPASTDADMKSGRVLKVSDGKPEVFLTAHLRACTHAGCKVSKPSSETTKLGCACHGSEFNAITGAVLKGPARKALAGIKLEVKGSKVLAVGMLE